MTPTKRTASLTQCRMLLFRTFLTSSALGFSRKQWLCLLHSPWEGEMDHLSTDLELFFRVDNRPLSIWLSSFLYDAVDHGCVLRQDLQATSWLCLIILLCVITSELLFTETFFKLSDAYLQWLLRWQLVSWHLILLGTVLFMIVACVLAPFWLLLVLLDEQVND